MSLATRLAQERLALRFAVRIRGLPYIFANFPIPSDWDDGGGTLTYDSETYTWSSTLVTSDGFGSFSTISNPKGGIAESGTTTLTFWATGTQAVNTSDLWLGLIANSIHRTDIDRATVAQDIDANDTTWNVDATSEYASSGTVALYCNTETVTTDLSTKTGTTFTVTRGRYGSQGMFHAAPVASIYQTGGGAWVTSVPMAWEGRIVDLFAIPGVQSSGSVDFTPYGGSLGNSENGIIYRGVVVDHMVSSSLLTVSLEVADLTQLLNREVGARLPRATAGVYMKNPNSMPVLVDGGSWWVSFALWRREADGSFGPVAGHNNGSYSVVRLANAGGNLTAGLYTLGQIEEALAYTIATNHPQAVALDEYCNVGLVAFVDQETGARNMYIETTFADVSRLYAFEILPNAANGFTIWRELGYEDGQIIEAESISPPGLFAFEADKGACVFRLPRKGVNGDWGEGRTRIHYRTPEAGVEAFDASPGWVNDAGNAVPGYVRVGDHEVVSIGAVGTEFLYNTFGYLTISGRNQYGSQLDEEVYVEWNADPDEVDTFELVQGVCLPETSIENAALQLLVGGSGVDQHNSSNDHGWRDGGINLPGNIVNTASFTAAHADRIDTRDGIGVFSATPYREVFADEFVVNQTVLVAQWHDTLGFRISLVNIESPPITETPTISIDDSYTVSLGSNGVKYDSSHRKIINEIQWESGWDHASDKAWIDGSKSIHTTSQQTWARQVGLSVKIKSIHSVSAAEEKFHDLAAGLFAKYAHPYAVIELDSAKADTWTWGVHTYALLTHPAVPKLDAVGRGVENQLVTILAHKDEWMRLGKDVARSTVTVEMSDARGTLWAPSMYLASKSSDTSWTATANKYSASGASADATYFNDGDYVRVFRVGSESTAVIAQISTIVGNAITFAGSGVTLAAPCIVEQVDYDHANITAAQKKYLYMTDGDHKLDLDGGGFDPFMEYYG